MKKVYLICLLVAAVTLAGCGNKELKSGANSNVQLDTCLEQGGTYLTDENGESVCNLP